MLRRHLFTKYVALILSTVTVALILSGGIGMYFSFRETEAHLFALQQEKAQGAANRIEQYITDIDREIAWTALPYVNVKKTTTEVRRLEYLKLLRQVPAITDVMWIDAAGREQLTLSRLAMDTASSNADRSAEPRFIQAVAGQIWHGPVYFRKDTEPYMTISRPGGLDSGGVTAVEVNLKFVWDIINQIRIGRSGIAYVVNGDGILVAHPDISLVLQKKDLSHLPQIAPLLSRTARLASPLPYIARNARGEKVLGANTRIPTLDWQVLVEMPLAEAYAPLYASLSRTAILLVAGLGLSVLAALFLARHMVKPIAALQAGAAQIGAGHLDQRIEVHTRDELEALAGQFNKMASQLEQSYAGLERKVDERTRELSESLEQLERIGREKDELLLQRSEQERLASQARREAETAKLAAENADLAKTTFLSAASHDLRQPMHALVQYFAHLRRENRQQGLDDTVDRIGKSIDALQNLLDSVLEVSKLMMGAVQPAISTFRISEILDRLDAQLRPLATEKGLRLQIEVTTAVVRSDSVLLERILRNLALNAIRYTNSGRVLVRCRRRKGFCSVQIWDTGIGIPKDKIDKIFEEFYQIGNAARDSRRGLGLGLALVRQMCKLLHHRIRVRSVLRKGSLFVVDVPTATHADRLDVPDAPEGEDGRELLRGALVALIDDNAMGREATEHTLRALGCRVVAGESGAAVAQLLRREGYPVNLILADYRLNDGETGIDAIRLVMDDQRALFGQEFGAPALLVSGDTSPLELTKVRGAGYTMLHKPVDAGVLEREISRRLEDKARAIGL
jgi:signal transduction histidine kinase/CheY-like chemotaxis protein